MSESVYVSIENNLCIICQRKKGIPLTSTENGRNRLIQAADTRRDHVYDRLQLLTSRGKYY